MYHGEEAQEDFLVLAGEGILIVEGEERPLKAWDFVHCPPWTKHVIVAAGSEPLVVIAVGARGKPGLVYPVEEAALKHGAGVSQETTDGDEAYAGTSEVVRTRYVEGDLPATLAQGDGAGGANPPACGSGACFAGGVRRRLSFCPRSTGSRS